ncbi:3D domain-containing protein [Listeria booriae]|uniref:3D domain-containing protein n=1 Tax=Listeria booriae TaxID=1552123 RepID=A0A7X0TL49_9LIST|nr:3D domain-containing protein [Listeria booriae]MBC1331112.1 hypothetical protein [Listeria booriae]MBC2386422.1 hypothetical protein [Listeria booriae]
MSTGLALTPPAPTIEAQQLVEQVAPHAYVWRAESEQKQAQIDALERKLKQKDAELAQLKRVEESAAQTPKASASTTTATSGWQTGEFTAYWGIDDGMNGGVITAKGDDISKSIYYKGYRIVAASKNVPFNSIIEINVNGQMIKGIKRDTGNAITDGKIDITFTNGAECKTFGRQHGKYRIIGRLE